MRLAAPLIACLAAGTTLPALAQSLDPALAGGTVLQVTGVAASDTLNVRRAPSASAPIVGTLSPLADFVILRERRGGWARIEYERGVSTPVRGWVSARYLELADADAGPEDGAWSCFGTEPFWLVWIEGGQVRHRTDLGTTIAPLANLRQRGRSWAFTFDEGGQRSIALMTSGTVCNNGMSDNNWRRTLLLTTPEGGVLDACCNRPGADERPPEPGPP
jgi:uncharacterized membrane protein